MWLHTSVLQGFRPWFLVQIKVLVTPLICSWFVLCLLMWSRHLGIVFLCPLYKEKQGWHLRRTKSKNRTKCLQEWVSYQDREWCCTPGIPVPAPDRSDHRTWALGWCRFSCGCGSPGCSPCCTATRRSRTTSLRSWCFRRSYRGGERLLCGKSVDRVTVLSILPGYNVISVHFLHLFPGMLYKKSWAELCAFVLRAAREKQFSFLKC